MAMGQYWRDFLSIFSYPIKIENFPPPQNVTNITSANEFLLNKDNKEIKINK